MAVRGHMTRLAAAMSLSLTFHHLAQAQNPATETTISDPQMRDLRIIITDVCLSPDRNSRVVVVKTGIGASAILRLLGLKASADVEVDDRHGIEDAISDRADFRKCSLEMARIILLSAKKPEAALPPVPQTISREYFFCGASNKAGCSDDDRSCVHPEPGNTFDIRSVTVRENPVHDAKAWVTSQTPDEVCVRANASVDNQGRNSRVNAKLNVYEVMVSGKSPPDKLFPNSKQPFPDVQ